MKRTITRGLALAALTAGFTVLGATAANAIDLPDLGGGDSGGLLGGGLLDLGGGDDSILNDLEVLVDVPVVVDGLNVGILDNSGVAGNDLLGEGLLGDGIVATTGTSTIDVLAALGIDTTGLLGSSDALTAIVGVPLDASNTWLSVFGNEPNGIVVVPNLSGTPAASVSDGVDGLLDAFVTVPIDISCSSVTVLSDYENDCTGGTPGDGGSNGGGILDGDLLDGLLDGGVLGGGLLGGGLLDGDILAGGVGDGVLDGLLGGDLLGDDPLDGDIISGDLLDGELLGDTNGDGQITIEDKELGVLDGGVLGEGLTTDEGVLVDFDDQDADGYSDVDLSGADTIRGLDLSETWLSALGGNDGVVLVPDLTLDLSLLTGGLISHEIIEPIVIDCVTVTVLSDYERACSTGPTEPTDPTGPTDPTDPQQPIDPTDPTTDPQAPVDGGGDNGGDNNGGNGDGQGITDPCAVAPASATVLTAQSEPVSMAMVAAAALAGALAAMGLMLLGRRLGRQQ